MSKVIKLDDKLKKKIIKQQVKDHQEKIDTVTRTVQCSSCHLKCAMCGCHLNSSGSSLSGNGFTRDFTLCDDCRDEFKDYLDMLNGAKGKNISWHNEEWMELWSSWLNFQNAVKEFRNSAEFKELLREITD